MLTEKQLAIFNNKLLKIENKKEAEDEYDWNAEENIPQPKQSDIDNEIIKNIFDSLRSEEKNIG